MHTWSPLMMKVKGLGLLAVIIWQPSTVKLLCLSSSPARCGVGWGKDAWFSQSCILDTKFELPCLPHQNKQEPRGSSHGLEENVDLFGVNLSYLEPFKAI